MHWIVDFKGIAMNIGIIEVLNGASKRVGGFKPLPKHANEFTYWTKGDSPYMMFGHSTIETVLHDRLKWHLVDPPRAVDLALIHLGNGLYDASIEEDTEDRWVSSVLAFWFTDLKGELWEIYKVSSSNNINLNGSAHHHIGSGIEYSELLKQQSAVTCSNMDRMLNGLIKYI